MSGALVVLVGVSTDEPIEGRSMRDHQMQLGYVAREDGEDAVMIRPDGTEAGRWKAEEITVAEFRRKIADDYASRLSGSQEPVEVMHR